MYYSSKYGLKNIPIGLFSADYPTLKDRQVIRMKNEIPEFLGKIRETRDEGYAFISAPEYGSFNVLLRNLDDPSKYKSAEFAAVLVEELTENPESTFDDLRFRMRYGNIEDVKFIGATNPGGVGHGFVKRKWVKPDDENPDTEQNRFFYIPAKYNDNKFTTEEYVKQLAALPEEKRRAYMEGDWDIFAGQYFSEWRDNTHICAPFIPLKTNIIIGGMDWGRAKPFSFHLAEVSRIQLENGVKFYRVKTFLEVYGTEKTPAEWAEEIKTKLRRYNIKLSEVVWVQGDPAMWTKGQDNSISIKDQFVKADEGWRVLKPGSNDRVGGWENYHNWLRIAPDGLPYYMVSSECPNLIRTLPELVHDDLKVEDVDSDGEDHAPDDQRYMLKKVKWIDAGQLGAMVHPLPGRRTLPIAPGFIDNKQVSINLDTFSDPKGINDESYGGVRH